MTVLCTKVRTDDASCCQCVMSHVAFLTKKIISANRCNGGSVQIHPIRPRYVIRITYPVKTFQFELNYAYVRIVAYVLWSVVVQNGHNVVDCVVFEESPRHLGMYYVVVH